MNKTYNILFLLFVMFMLSAPALKHLTSDDQLLSDENRTLAQLPSWPKNFSELKIYTDSMDAYFNDQMGFRSALISGANKFKYAFFNEVISNQITVGKEGFLYFNSHFANQPHSLIRSTCGVNRLSRRFQKKSKNLIQEYLDHFNQSGIKTSIAIIPVKARIYTENLPELERSWCLENPVTWKDQLIHSITDPMMYYPLEKMRQLKSKLPVYLPSYFHWHGELPYIIAEDIMKHLWDLDDLLNVSSRKVNIKTDMRFHIEGLNIYENSVEFDYSELDLVICQGFHCIPGIEKHSDNNILVYTYTRNQPGPVLLLITDSFGNNIASNFIRGFSKVIHIDSNNLSKDKHAALYDFLITTQKPSHLLFLFHDGGLYGQTLNLEQLLTDLK